MSTATIGYGQPNRVGGLGGAGKDPNGSKGQSRPAQPAGVPGRLTIRASRDAFWAPSVTLHILGPDGQYHLFEGTVQYEQNLEVARLVGQTRTMTVVEVIVTVHHFRVGDMAFINSVGAVIQPDRSRSSSRSSQTSARRGGRSRSASREDRSQSRDRGRAG